MHGRKEHVDHAGVVSLRRERAESLIEAIGIPPRKLRARADAEQREVAEGRLADVREGREGAWLLRRLHHGLYNTVEMPARLHKPPYRRVPWKNGLGTTLELATDADEPGGPWSWRMSIADVPSRSAFSRFDGVDRRLAVLEGAGMELFEAGSTRVIVVPREGEAHAFRGEDALEGAPIGSGVRDVNLFFARTAWTGAMRVIRGESPALSLCAEVVLAYLHEAPEPLRIEVDGTPAELEAGSLAIASRLTLAATPPATTLVLARLDRVR